MTDLQDTQPFTPVFDGTATQPLVTAARHRRARPRWLAPVCLVLSLGILGGVAWTVTQPQPDGPVTVVGPTVSATTRVTAAGTVSIPADGATMPSSPAVSASVAAVAATSVRRSTTAPARPSPSRSTSASPVRPPAPASPSRPSPPSPSDSSSSAAAPSASSSPPSPPSESDSPE